MHHTRSSLQNNDLYPCANFRKTLAITYRILVRLLVGEEWTNLRRQRWLKAGSLWAASWRSAVWDTFLFYSATPFVFLTGQWPRRLVPRFSQEVPRIHSQGRPCGIFVWQSAFSTDYCRSVAGLLCQLSFQHCSVSIHWSIGELTLGNRLPFHKDIILHAMRMKKKWTPLKVEAFWEVTPCLLVNT